MLVRLVRSLFLGCVLLQTLPVAAECLQDNPPPEDSTLEYYAEFGGSNESFTLSGLWHVEHGCHTADAAHVSGDALFFGAACGVPTGQAQSGSALSTSIDLTALGPQLVLSFTYFLGTATTNTPDDASVYISKNGGAFSKVMSNLTDVAPPVRLCDGTGTWHTANLDISSYAGSSIRVRFDYATLDSNVTAAAGFYVDDVSIYLLGNDPACTVANRFFEFGFAGWTHTANHLPELQPWRVGYTNSGPFGNAVLPSGNPIVQNGFSGAAGLTYDLYQEVSIPSTSGVANLTWFDRIQWDYTQGTAAATLPRVFEITIQPAGGGAPIATVYQYTLDPAQPKFDTGTVTHGVDLLEAAPQIAGTTVRINFHQSIPEANTGPGQFDLGGVCIRQICRNSFLASLTPSSPHYNRISADTVSLTCDAPSVDSPENNMPYEAFPIRTSVAENLVAGVTAAAGVADSVLSLYCAPFDPLHPELNLVAFDDNSGPGAQAAFLDSMGITLQPDTTYWIVVSTATGNDTDGGYAEVCLGGHVFKGECRDVAPGARVECLIDLPDNSNCIYKGSRGTVVCRTVNISIEWLVEWDQITCGNDGLAGCGTTEPGRGWYVGQRSLQAVCDVECNPDSLLGQRPDINATGTYSNDGTPYSACDQFSGLAGPINAVRWWSIQYNGAVCDRTPDTYEVSIHENDQGALGTTVIAASGLPFKRDSGLSLGGIIIYEYTLVLPAPIALSKGWVCIKGTGDATCFMGWLAGTGPGLAYAYNNNTWLPLNASLALCLLPEGVDPSGEGEGEGDPSLSLQSADQDGDHVIQLAELLRVIQFYNSLAYHCADVPADTEDGYVPGPGVNHACEPYDTDYNPQDWVISLTELLRAIQFYNSLGYYYCPLDGTEDGFCPGPAV